MKFIQIAVTSDVENGENLYALGDDGNIYERTCVHYFPGAKYQGKHIMQGRASSAPFWSIMDLPFSEPALENKQLFKLSLESIAEEV